MFSRDFSNRKINIRENELQYESTRLFPMGIADVCSC